MPSEKRPATSFPTPNSPQEEKGWKPQNKPPARPAAAAPPRPASSGPGGASPKDSKE